jgi:hypothetical protein
MKEHWNALNSQIDKLNAQLADSLVDKTQMDRDLKAAMEDLGAAILENERLNSERLVDDTEKAEAKSRNDELKR